MSCHDLDLDQLARDVEYLLLLSDRSELTVAEDIARVDLLIYVRRQLTVRGRDPLGRDVDVDMEEWRAQRDAVRQAALDRATDISARWREWTADRDEQRAVEGVPA